MLLLESLSEREIMVPLVLERPHRLIRTARTHLRNRKPDKYGMIWAIDDCVNIRISKAQLIRGLTLLNTIFRELEHLGFQIDISKGGTAVLDEDGTEITIALNERSRRIANPPPKEGGSWWMHEKYSFEPSGELEIVLGRFLIGESHWKDTAARTLESRTRDILSGIITSMEMVKKENDRRDKEEEVLQQLEREREIIRQIESQERQRKNILQDRAANWQRAEQLRRFISVATAIVSDKSGLNRSQILKWTEWATKHADEIDPLTNGGILKDVQELQPYD